LANEGAIVVGIDLAEAGLEVAKLHLLESGFDIDYQFISAEDLTDSESESFDVITCLEMLEHVPDPSLIIDACSKLVKQNGRVFFSTINRNPKSYFFAIVGAEYVLNLLPKGTHNYEKFIRPSEIDGWARACNLSVSSMIGMTYNPITKKYKLSDDVSVNFISHYYKN
jgi:2-polyprenyl-6-hydroxyphenyl methylase/3-demethylubiquinone-9 3-methyltransferase